MNRRIITAGIALIALGSIVLTARAQSERVVKAQGYVSVDAIRRSDKFKVAVSLHIEDGYHINGHVPSEDDLIATKVTLGGAPGVQFGEPVYPAAVERSFEFSPNKKLAVYEGTVTVTADGEAGPDTGVGTGVIKAQIQVQSCNNSQCLAPATIDLDIPVKVVSAGTAINPANQNIFSAADSAAAAVATAPQSAPTSCRRIWPEPAPVGRASLPAIPLPLQ